MSVTVMSFSGVYKEQEFYQSKRIDKRVEAEQVEETNCYCTEEAEEKIKKLIESYPEKGIHFLDSGNYHYVTKFWMEKLTKPFALVLFDPAYRYAGGSVFRTSFLWKLGKGST